MSDPAAQLERSVTSSVRQELQRRYVVPIESLESEYRFMLPSGCGAKIAVTLLTAIEVAQASFKICRSLTRFVPPMLHDAIGVLSRRPEMMNACAKRSTGFLKDALFPR